ncbi:hypothetical protein N656DRAFT_785107 [Canariomyces notabilis]|uniref:Uncharacterized protein n=1 Tax=Canariomyces notabilis TaxID=2074819 RepID=A0AAN6QI05_9PEZI|nr:hypothetical protein N656DRAFT_785107 [Canariomyces arenarius]
MSSRLRSSASIAQHSVISVAPAMGIVSTISESIAEERSCIGHVANDQDTQRRFSPGLRAKYDVRASAASLADWSPRFEGIEAGPVGRCPLSRFMWDAGTGGTRTPLAL